jgi:hypothetical protein
MPLPKIAVPTYFLTIPSTGQEIKYRPFLVKEEKILLFAVESEDIKEITNAMRTILANCIETKGIKVESLPSFDIEYLFLNIRKRSVGEEFELKVICPDDGVTEVKVTLNIDDIKVVHNPEHTNKFKIAENAILELRYPTIDQFIKENFNIETPNINETFDAIIECIDNLYMDENAYAKNDYSKEEWKEFFDGIVFSEDFLKIQSFFDTMPKLSHTIEVKNPKTKVKSKVKLEGLGSFFTSQ